MWYVVVGLNNISYRCWVIVTTNFIPFPRELIAEKFSKAEEISLHTSGCTKLDKDVVESFCINSSLFLMWIELQRLETQHQDRS